MSYFVAMALHLNRKIGIIDIYKYQRAFWPFFMTGVFMNNNKDDKEKKIIKIDLDNIEDLSEEEIMELINDLASKEINSNKKETFFEKVKKNCILYIKKFIIDFILIFTINSIVGVIDGSFLNFIIYFLIFNAIDFIFNRYLTKKFPLVMMITFGIINFIITYLSFIVSAIICLQVMNISFSSFITYSVSIIVFYIIKKFVLYYFEKLRKRGKIDVSNK